MLNILTKESLTIIHLCPQWKSEILDFCPSTRILLIGCKIDLRTDVCTLMELSNLKQTPITYEQVRTTRSLFFSKAELKLAGPGIFLFVMWAFLIKEIKISFRDAPRLVCWPEPDDFQPNQSRQVRSL